MNRWIFFFFFFFSCLFGDCFPIYVQASKGSFNHQALEIFLQNPISDEKVHFCKTPQNTLATAVKQDGYGFIAIKNTIQGYVQASVEALKIYKPTEVVTITEMKIEQSLMRSQESLKCNIPLKKIASHPAALKQINKWKNNHPFLEEIAVEEGTSEAAKNLSEGIFDGSTAVVGPKSLVSLYPNLVVVETAIQDCEDNFTTFMLAKFEVRKTFINELEVKKELEALLKIK